MRRICVLCVGCFWLFAAVAWASASAIRAVASSGHSSSTPAAARSGATRARPARPTASTADARRAQLGRSGRRSLTRACATSKPALRTRVPCRRIPLTVLLGDRTIETGRRSNPAGLAEAFPFRARGNGTGSALTVYIDSHNRARSIVTGVYADAHGLPGARLAAGSLRRPKAGAWNVVSLSSTAVRSGRRYWLVVLGQGGKVSFRDRPRGSCAGETSSQQHLTLLPASWRMGARWNACPMSAYVAGVAHAAALPTPTHAPINTVTGAAPAAGAGSGSTANGTNSTTGTGTSTGTSTDPLPPLLPPVNLAAPAISGSAQQGSTLTTTDGTWLNGPTSYAYQWEDCDSSGASCASISGARSASYVLASQDVGHTIRVLVTASNGAGSGQATSGQTAVVSSLPAPVSSAAPVISGSTQQGNTLTTTKGSWQNGPTSYAYQWEDCDSSGASCASISGARSASYVLASQDVGHTIRVLVTASNGGGSGQATSGQTGIVTPVPAPVNTVAPAINGSTQQGDTLTTTNGSWQNGPTSYAYQWEDCDSSGASCASISGARSASYVLASQDVGHTIRVVVTASNGGGSGQGTSGQTAVVTAASSGGSFSCPSGVRCFFVASGGSDSNSGTSEGAPWAHAPGMRSFTGSYSHQVGDEFIFKGGDTWHNANFPLAAPGAGSAAHNDLYGVDKSWYDGSSWSRPVFDGDDANIAGSDPHLGAADVFFDLTNADYTTIDNIEFANWYESGIATNEQCNVVDLSTDTNITINHILVTGMAIQDQNRDCVVAQAQNSSPFGGNSILENSTITGNGSTYGSATWCLANVENNTISGLVAMVYPCVATNGTGTISGNLLYDCGSPSFPAGASGLHGDTILVDVTGNPSTLYIHDNVIHDTGGNGGGECESMWVGNTGETDYIYNNVIYNLHGSGIAIKIGDNGGNTSAGTAYVWDNTLTGSDDYANPCITGYSSGYPSVAVTVQNNLCVTNSANALGTFYCTGGGTACQTINHNLSLTPSQMNTDVSNGMFSTSPYMYSETSTNSPTNAAGANLTSHCTGPITTLCTDTTYAGTRTTGPRPNTNPWDIGAYQTP